MPQVHRLGDANSAGGVITSIPQSTVFVNGKLVSVDGSKGTGHAPFEPPHTDGDWSTANGTATITAGGLPINATGDSDSCGHPRASGSPNVFIGS